MAVPPFFIAPILGWRTGKPLQTVMNGGVVDAEDHGDSGQTISATVAKRVPRCPSWLLGFARFGKNISAGDVKR
jgi:hypothetical protein